MGEQTILDNGQGMTTLHCYDANAQVIGVYEYGLQSEGLQGSAPSCASFSGLNTAAIGPLDRQTTTTYHPFFQGFSNNNGNGTVVGTHIVDAPDSITVADGSANTFAQTNFTYTNTVQSSSPPTAVGLVSPPGPDRGNIASIAKLISTGVWATTTYTYFDAGQLQSMTDPCGNATCNDVTGSNHTTTYSYADNFAGGTGTPPGETNAYLTSVTFPNTGVSHTQSFTWGYSDGQIRSSTDQNGQSTNYLYNDPGYLARLTEVDYPDYPTNGDKLTVGYNDATYSAANDFNPAHNTPNFTTSRSITSSLNLVNTTAFDGLGHTVRGLLTSDPEGADANDNILDGFGRTRTKPNPYRSSASTTDGSSVTSYDALGRVTSVLEPDGSTVATSYSGQCTTVTDEAGKSRQSCVDGLGHLVKVFEDPGASPHLNLETDYTYDVLGNLLTVTQKGGSTISSNWRPRSFTYDNLSRLLTATNPESGMIQYTYDANGNVSAKQAPSPNETNSGTKVTTSYFYDALNRLVTKSYTDSYSPPNPLTTMATYGYDGIAATSCTPPTLSDSYPKGHRTSMCDGSGAASWSHDQLGRTITESRKVNGYTRNISYGYNLDGSLASITYPSGRLVSYTPGGAGRPTAVADSTGPINYVQGAKYAPFGGLTDMTQGATPITIKNRYSPRLQPVLLSAYTSAATIMSLCYDFHSAVALSSSSYGPCSFSASSAGDNGNVYQIVNNRDNNRTQNFLYDSLNRISQGYSSGPNWGETYSPNASNPGVQPTAPGIDNWGNLTNRSQVNGKTQYESLNCPANTNNQLTTCGLTYDAAGNAYVNNGVTYTYDAENRLVTPGAGNGTYLYDGDGNRMARLFSSSGTEYWRDLSGNTLLEDSNTGVNLREYIYFAGKKIARRDVVTNNVHYVFSDHLGSSSIITDALGTMASCNGYVSGQFESDYYPYGGEMSICNNLGDQNYKFTGKERDVESGLDYFGARYNASNFGRFMTPDWAAKPTTVPYAKFGDPQTLNLYAYVENSPVNRADADGHCDTVKTCVQWTKDFMWAFKTTSVNVTKSAYVVNEQSKDPKVALTKSDVKAIGASVSATASGSNSSIKASVTPGVTSSLTFGAGNVKGTVTDNFATASAGASVGPDRTGAEAKAELLNWGGSLSIGGVELSGNVCLLCAGAGASAGKTGFDVTAEAGLAGAGFSLTVGGKDVASKKETLGKTSVSGHVPYPIPNSQGEQEQQ